MAVSNTIDSALITDYLTDAFFTVAQNRLAAFGAFSTDFGTDPMKPKATVQVRKATAGATTKTNATDFSAANSTLDNVQVSVSQYTQAFGLSNADVQNGTKLEHIAEVNAAAFMDKLCDVAFAPITEANSGAGSASFTGAYQTFTEDDLIAMYVNVKKAPRKFAVLDSGYFAKMKFQKKTEFRDGAGSFLGFENIFENTRWDGAGTNIKGFACGSNAIAIASGLPISMPGQNYIEYRTLTLPIGLSVLYTLYFEPESRQLNAAWDVMLGAALGDGTVLDVIKSA